MDAMLGWRGTPMYETDSEPREVGDTSIGFAS
jgi:hypothetical protein